MDRLKIGFALFCEIMILHDAKELHKSAFWLQTDANVANSDECCWF